MAASRSVLFYSSDDPLIDAVRETIEDGGRFEVDVLRTVDEKRPSATAPLASLVLLHLPEGTADNEVAMLLWKVMMANRHVPVVVIDDSYHEERASILFRLGVADYLSRTDHLGSLPDVRDALAVRPSRRPKRVATGASKGENQRRHVSFPA